MTSNGKITEYAEGTVVSVNDRGVKLAGTDAYMNFSKYADPPIVPPRRGANVRLGLDGDGFVREVREVQATEPGGIEDLVIARDWATHRDGEIRRMAAMKAAAHLVGQFAHIREEVKVDHVFPLADKILAWLEQPEAEPST